VRLDPVDLGSPRRAFEAETVEEAGRDETSPLEAFVPGSPSRITAVTGSVSIQRRSSIVLKSESRSLWRAFLGVIDISVDGESLLEDKRLLGRRAARRDYGFACAISLMILWCPTLRAYAALVFQAARFKGMSVAGRLFCV